MEFLTMKDLTSAQRDELTQQYVEIVVDNMDTKDLVRYAIEQLIAYHNEDSIECLKEDIDNYDEELWEELVDNVTQQYAKLPNTFGGQS
jgi:DNA replicative helicase MCM subunit Mcm2 (Cdc46/Mcm family)